MALSDYRLDLIACVVIVLVIGLVSGMAFSTNFFGISEKTNMLENQNANQQSNQNDNAINTNQQASQNGNATSTNQGNSQSNEPVQQAVYFQSFTEYYSGMIDSLKANSIDFEKYFGENTKINDATPKPM